MSTKPLSAATPKASSSNLNFKSVVLKPAVKAAQAILPTKLFDTIYDTLFPMYKGLVRQGYLTSAYVTGRSKDQDALGMVKRVYSVMPYSLVGQGGLEVTDWAARTAIAEEVEGDYAELGVARGGCAALLAMQLTKPEGAPRTLWLFDSYEGLPEPGENDYLEDGETTGDHVRPLPKGSCLGMLEEVQWLLFDHFSLPKDRITFVKGWFENTVPAKANEIEKLALLRLDGDWYESTRICLVNLYDKVSLDGFVIIDDYDSCAGSKRAVDEFLLENAIRVELKSDGRGGRWFRKPA